MEKLLTLGRRVGSADRTDLDPGLLRRVTLSEDALTARLRAGAGIDSLEPEERRMLAEGVQGQRRLDWMVGEVISRHARLG